MHLVRRFFEPAKKTFHTVPVLRPRLVVLVAVAGFAVDDERFLFVGERGERDVGGDFFLFGEDAEVVEGRAIDFAFPTFQGAAVDRERLVGDREAVVDLDDAPEAAALRAGAEWRVEGKKGGRGGAKRASGFGRMEAAGKVTELRERVRREEMNLTVAEMQ